MSYASPNSPTEGRKTKKWSWPTTSRHERGYGSDWDRIRKVALARDCGMCMCKNCKGVKLYATEVHHIKPKSKGGTNELQNLQSINHECHKLETSHHNNFKGIGKKIGLDGFPIVEEKKEAKQNPQSRSGWTTRTGNVGA